MRKKQEEIKNYILKNKRKSKCKETYEVVSECKHISALSFDVTEDRLKLWKDVLYIRYYLHLGRIEDMFVNMKTSYDLERNVVEENYLIEKKDGNKKKKILDICLYNTTGKIMVRGPRRNEWKYKEFELLKNSISGQIHRMDIITQYCTNAKCEIIQLIHPESNEITYDDEKGKDEEILENELDEISTKIVTDCLKQVKEEMAKPNLVMDEKKSPKRKNRSSMKKL